MRRKTAAGKPQRRQAEGAPRTPEARRLRGGQHRQRRRHLMKVVAEKATAGGDRQRAHRTPTDHEETEGVLAAAAPPEDHRPNAEDPDEDGGNDAVRDARRAGPELREPEPLPDVRRVEREPEQRRVERPRPLHRPERHAEGHGDAEADRPPAPQQAGPPGGDARSPGDRDKEGGAPRPDTCREPRRPPGPRRREARRSAPARSRADRAAPTPSAEAACRARSSPRARRSRAASW